MEAVISLVNQTLTESFEIPNEKLREDAKLYEDLGLDSLDAVDMLVYIEEKFDIRVKGEEFKEVRTVGDVYRMVHTLVGSIESKN